MAATLEVPTLVDDPPQVDVGSWTAREIQEAERLARAASADRARWAFSDWLLDRLPWQSTGVNSGAYQRIDELSEIVGWSSERLRELRATAYAWPPATRLLEDAGFDAHSAFRRGGPAAAETRRAQLLDLPRGQTGRISHSAVRELRRYAPGQRPRVTVPRRPPITAEDAPAEVVELLRDCEALLRRADELLRSGVLPAVVTRALDQLIGPLETLAGALNGKHAPPAHVRNADAPR